MITVFLMIEEKLGFKIDVKISEIAQVSYQSNNIMIQSQLNIDSA